MTDELRTESTKYSPTSLEKGMKYFNLPAELMKMDIYNMVDLDKTRTVTAGTILAIEDKELLLSIDELERKFIAPNSDNGDIRPSSKTRSQSQPLVSSDHDGTSAKQAYKTQNSNKEPNKKFVRPDVTWLRRTEYISSVKNNPNSMNVSISTDDAKALLADRVDFEQVCREVSSTFNQIKDNKHPFKSADQVKLIQSFPISLISNLADGTEDVLSYSHCLVLGDNSANGNSVLKLGGNIVTLFNHSADEMDTQIFKSHGEFDIQKSEKSKSFVLMLPTDNSIVNSRALLNKINSTFSLRKKRASHKNGVNKSSKAIKIMKK